MITLMAASESELPSLAPKPVEGSSFLTDTMIVTFIVSLILIVLSLIIRFVLIPKWRKDLTKITPVQNVLESLVEMFSGSAKDSVGHNAGFVGAWYFVMSSFIFLGVAIEMFGLRPAVTDLNLNLVLGLMTFALIHFYGFKAKRAQRIKHYLNPIFDISDVILPFSMALRLFGSVFSGYLLMHLIYGALPVYLQIIIPIIGTIMFTLFHALVQSYVYMTLSMNLIGEAAE